jgi:LuxR family maltose regulon positive regulatory protein
VVGGSASARTLEELQRRNLLVVPLDRRGEWYRYHHLLRELLLAELRRSEPDRVADLHQRAATWYEANRMFESAIEHADAAGDTGMAARIILEEMQPVWAQGQVETVRSWMELLDNRQHMPHHAAVAAHGALIFALLGRAAEAERWAGVAESLPTTGTLPDGSTVVATLAYLRANLARDGTERMRVDAELALDGLSPASPYRGTMHHVEAMSWLLEGELDRADRAFTRALDVAHSFGIVPLAALILAEQALIAAAQDEWAAVDSMLKSAVELIDGGHFDAYWTSALVFAMSARAAAHRGDTGEARRFVRRTARLRPLLTHSLPVVSVQSLLELARAYLALVDPSGARAALDQAQGILRRRPDLGTLAADAVQLQTRLDQITAAAAVGASALTTAELRLVPLLPTHLSMPQIAEQLFVSRHTVKSQVKSVYRKLGVSSRREAVEVMTKMGVL